MSIEGGDTRDLKDYIGKDCLITVLGYGKIRGTLVRVLELTENLTVTIQCERLGPITVPASKIIEIEAFGPFPV